MNSTFEEYLKAVKQRRDEDNYDYTDEDLEKYSSWIKTCHKRNISCYKCLELMWFETDKGKEQVQKLYGI